MIKGLTEVANKRPEDPIAFLANYLYNFANIKKSDNSKYNISDNDANEVINPTKVEIEPIIHHRDENEGEEPEINYVNDNNVEEVVDEKETELIEKQMDMIPVKQMDDENNLNSIDDDIPISPDGPEIAPNSEDRDEHGQSMLHFACARSHGRNGLIQLIEESGTSITYRDELYRTARDVSLQASQPENAREIDRYVLNLAARGK